MLLLDQWKKSEPLISPVSAIWDNLWCSVCQRNAHNPEVPCSHHEELIHVKDREVPKTHATLPDQFYIAQAAPDLQQEAVYARVPLAANVVLGPLQAPVEELPDHQVTAQSAAQWLNNHWLVFHNTGLPSLLKCEDGSQCNWVSLIRPYRSQEALTAKSKHNLTAFQYKGDIYFMTTKAIKVYEELLYDYSSGYSTLLHLFLQSNTERSESSWTQRYSVELALQRLLLNASDLVPAASEDSKEEESQNCASESLSEIEKAVDSIEGVVVSKAGSSGDGIAELRQLGMVPRLLCDVHTQTDEVGTNSGTRKRPRRSVDSGKGSKRTRAHGGRKGGKVALPSDACILGNVKSQTDMKVVVKLEPLPETTVQKYSKRKGRVRPKKTAKVSDEQTDELEALKSEGEADQTLAVSPSEGLEATSEPKPSGEGSDEQEDTDENLDSTLEQDGDVPLEAGEEPHVPWLKQESCEWLQDFEDAVGDHSDESLHEDGSPMKTTPKKMLRKGKKSSPGKKKRGRPKKSLEPVDDDSFDIDPDQDESLELDRSEEDSGRSEERAILKQIELLAERVVRLSVLYCTEEDPSITENMDTVLKIEVRLWYIPQELIDTKDGARSVTLSGGHTLDITDKLAPLDPLTKTIKDKLCSIAISHPEKWGDHIDTSIVNHTLDNLAPSDRGMGVCNMCGWTSNKPNNVKFHLIRTHTSIRDYLCDFCGAKFRDWRQLGRHKLQHVPAESQVKYYCPICRKAFNRKDKLGRHIRIHDGSNLTQICDYCGKPFRCKDHLRRHVDTVHLNLRLYECPICHRSYKEKRDMKRHVQSVHSIDPDVALEQNPDGTFSLKGKVEEMCVVQQKQPCPMCSSAFRDQRDLRRHIKKKHSVEEQDAFAAVAASSGDMKGPGIFATPVVSGQTLESVDQLQTAVHNMEVPQPGPSGEGATMVDNRELVQTVHIGPTGAAIALPYEYHMVDVQQLTSQQLNALGYTTANV